MGYSISVDWREQYEQWENEGRRVMIDYYQAHPKAVKDEGYDKADDDSIYELADRQEPMMNYAYPLETNPSDEKILKVCQNTNCTVMYKPDSEEYYLALTGGGMDLSQDIAYAYQITDGWLPKDLLVEVCHQPELSVHGTKWLKMAEQIRKQLKIEAKRCKWNDKEWADAIKQYSVNRAERKKRLEAQKNDPEKPVQA
jgi:hypothetical protein